MAVIGRPGLAFREELRLLHPAMSAFKHSLRVGLEYQSLARSESVRIDHAMIFLGQFFQKVVLVAFRLKVDISLRALERVKVALYIFDLGIFVQSGSRS